MARRLAIHSSERHNSVPLMLAFTNAGRVLHARRGLILAFDCLGDNQREAGTIPSNGEP